MLRLLLRAIGFLTLAGAFAAAVIDGARTLADQRLELTPMGVALATLFPKQFAALPGLVAKLNPKLWDPVLLSILYVPAFLDLAVIAFLILALTRRRPEPAAIGARR